MKPTRIKDRYKSRLIKYLEYRTGSFLRPTTMVDYQNDALPAAQCMFAWETFGTVPTLSSEPELLNDYIQGKQCRDWHITQWLRDTNSADHDCTMHPEELIGTLGMDCIEFAKVFGRAPDLRKVFFMRCVDKARRNVAARNKVLTWAVDQW